MKQGDRVETHPASDHWMRGDRYGDVLEVLPAPKDSAYRVVKVQLDKSGKVRRISEEFLTVL